MRKLIDPDRCTTCKGYGGWDEEKFGDDDNPFAHELPISIDWVRCSKCEGTGSYNPFKRAVQRALKAHGQDLPNV